MKKSIKYALLGIIVLAAVAGGVYYAMMPTPVRMTEVRLNLAELSFTEQGVVEAGNAVMVFASAQGELRGLYVSENQWVEVGDALVSVDANVHLLRLEQVQSGIRGLEAQLANIDVEADNLRQTLQTSRSTLQGELQAINAQAAQSGQTVANQQEVLDEQIRLQQILITQHQTDLALANENYQRVTQLYQGGVVARMDFEAARAAALAAHTLLEFAEGQMAVIAAGAIHDSAEHFEGMRAAIHAQIAGIDRQLAQDNTTATRAHFEALIAVEEASLALIKREIDNAVITAPVRGIVTTLHAQHTNFISPVSPVAEITVEGGQYIEVYVSTQDIGSINHGDTVGITFRQRVGDVRFSGTVVDIGDTAVVRFTALGVEERKVNVRIAPDIPDGINLGIGYGVDVTFYVFREEDRMAVPRTALFRDSGVYNVWVVRGGNEGIVKAVAVQTGMELRMETVIESGLNVGDFVVNDANNSDLRNGVRVVAE